MNNNPLKQQIQGILPINKPAGITSFDIVRTLRKLLNIKKIGHAGTLDPLATGVMVMLIGRPYTKLSDNLLNQDKEYVAIVKLGIETDSYDADGTITATSEYVPSHEEVEEALMQFQGSIEQIPPMFSAKKVDGKKLYQLARQGQTIERKPVTVQVATKLIEYAYPLLTLRVTCSKGTYLRSIAHDIGKILQCGGHVQSLERTRSGKYLIENCLTWKNLHDPNTDVTRYLEYSAKC